VAALDEGGESGGSGSGGLGGSGAGERGVTGWQAACSTSPWAMAHHVCQAILGLASTFSRPVSQAASGFPRMW
jgi:hypothetical protein